MSIRDRWISLLHRAATGTKKTRTLLTPIGVVIFGVFTGMFVILAVLVDRWLSLRWPLSNGLSWLIASTSDGHRCWRDSVVSVPFPEGEGNTCTLQPPTDARDDRSLPICQKPDADGGLSPPFWNWLRHQFTLTCRFIYSTLCVGKCLGTQRDRGAGIGEAIGRRLCCLSTTNPDVHT